MLNIIIVFLLILIGRYGANVTLSVIPQNKDVDLYRELKPSKMTANHVKCVRRIFYLRLY